VTSATLPSFWDSYGRLDHTLKAKARKAYRPWSEDPFHPSLRFKCVNREENVWSVRLSRGCRAIGLLEGDTVTWFWVGDHDEYERHFG
jgi:hypothetical protein